MSNMAWEQVLNSVPSSLTDAANSLYTLCLRIQTLISTKDSILHPSKCRCLAHSYSQLTLHVLSLFRCSSASSSSSSSSSSFPKLSMLLTLLLRTLEKGERFIKDCFYHVETKWWIPGAARKKRNEWLANNALAIVFSTGIFDVHLHDFVWCISMLIWVLSSDLGDGGLCGWIQAKRVGTLLKSIWASANKEDDAKSMRELFFRIRAEGHEQICDLICARLSDYEGASKGTASLTDIEVPTYLWMDSQVIEILPDDLISSSRSVLVCKAKMMGRTFACKHFYEQNEEEQFKYEAAVQAQLWHANVIDLVCCTPYKDKTPCLVMECLDGDLGSLIADRSKTGKGAPFSLLVELDLMLQVAKGMEYLHGLGIMHRDVKSPNILISLPTGADRLDKTAYVTAKIADFGVSKVKHDSSLYTTKRVGTRKWRAPEVFDDEDAAKYTNKADVYSFAIVCAEMLTGLPSDELLPRVNTKELCRLLKEGKRPDLPPKCPLAISSYIKKCWHGDASKRPGFTQICRALRFFKACILLEETEMLALPLQDDMLDVGELAMHRTPGRGHIEGTSHHPVLDIPYEVRIFQSIKEQKSPRRREGDMLKFLKSKIRRGSSAAAAILGEGSLGSAFKCDPGDGFIVAVRWLENIMSKREQVEQQIATMLELKHKNLVSLLAHFSNTENEHVLVSEYMTNGISLSNLLHDHRETRISGETIRMVAEDAASGIQYLHDHGWAHGHIKSSNILLIDDYAKCVLSDYGIATLVRDTAENVGYRAPELSMGKEADVYSYGMLLLELVTGLNPTIDREMLLWVNSQSREEKMSIVEQRSHINQFDSSMLMEMLQIASDCLAPNASQRPVMKQVRAMVEDSRQRSKSGPPLC